MSRRCLAFLIALAALALPACRTGPAVSDEGCDRPNTSPDASLVQNASGEGRAVGASASGPEASTAQGRHSAAPTTGVALNRGQGDAVAATTSYDGSATTSAGAPAVVQTLLGSQANALGALDGGDRGPVFKAYTESLAMVRARMLAETDPVKAAALDQREKEILATMERLETQRLQAATSLSGNFPALTTVVFTNASGSSAGSDKPAVDPANAAAIRDGLPKVIDAAKAKP